jgi:hypothetical protein
MRPLRARPSRPRPSRAQAPAISRPAAPMPKDPGAVAEEEYHPGPPPARRLPPQNRPGALHARTSRSFPGASPQLRRRAAAPSPPSPQVADERSGTSDGVRPRLPSPSPRPPPSSPDTVSPALRRAASVIIHPGHERCTNEPGGGSKRACEIRHEVLGVVAVVHRACPPRPAIPAEPRPHRGARGRCPSGNADGRRVPGVRAPAGRSVRWPVTRAGVAEGESAVTGDGTQLAGHRAHRGAQQPGAHARSRQVRRRLQ